MPNKAKKLSELITAYSDKLQLFEQKGALDVYSSWSSIVGEKIAAHCRLVDIERQRAVIETDHTGWCQQLLLNKKRIIRNFNIRYPQLEVKSISVIVSSEFHYTDKKNDRQIKTGIQHGTVIEDTVSPQGEAVKYTLPAEICGLLENLKVSIIERERSKKSG